MTKTEHNACLSTSQSFPTTAAAPPSLSVVEEWFNGENTESARHTPEKKMMMKPPARRPEYLLVSCYILIYLELGWLILMLLRTYSRH